MSLLASDEVEPIQLCDRPWRRRSAIDSIRARTVMGADLLPLSHVRTVSSGTSINRATSACVSDAARRNARREFIAYARRCHRVAIYRSDPRLS